MACASTAPGRGSVACAMESVGITLITGFLGSGKSSLIRRILTEDHGLRIVVVENEFGSTAAVERAIVTQGAGTDAVEEFIELPNGCICCQAQDDLVDSLTRLVEKKRGRFDHILVEASGLADPRPVAASFWVDAVADAALHLDSVVSVVDAARTDVRCSALARKQVAVADTVLLNKMDLVAGSEAEWENVQRKMVPELRRGGCVAKVIPTVRCDVDIAELLNRRAYDSDAAVSELRSSTAPEKFRHHIHDGGDTHNHGDEHGQHHGHEQDHEESPDSMKDGRSDEALSTFTLTFKDAVFEPTLLDRALGHMLWDEPENQELPSLTQGDAKDSDEDDSQPQIWRMKSLIVMRDEENKWIYQSVHTLFDDMVSSVSAQDGMSEFLFIGQNMNKQSIHSRLERAIVSDSSSGHQSST